MKKLFLIALCLLIMFVLVGCGGSSSTAETPVEESDQAGDKPDNYIEDLDMSTAIQKAFNQCSMLVGHFEREDLSNEDKIAFAQETEQTILPETQTIIYNMRSDSRDGGDYDNINLYTSNAYGSLQKMCEDMVEYCQTGDESYKTNFYEEKDRVTENLNKAKNMLNG